MKKYIIIWLLVFLSSIFCFFYIISWITNTMFVNIFNEFEVLLMLSGFSTVNASIFSCTKFINDKISNLKK
ncbi:Uncharacterised protein [Turicibacter sanguinis]|nr:Uncharacterised protein [Turicibacter sanguinis]